MRDVCLFSLLTSIMAIALISALSIRSYKQSKRKNNMQYTIIATVTKIDKKGVYIKGVGKYLFEDSNKKLWNLLEETKENHPTSIELGKQIELSMKDSLAESLLAVALLHKRPLLLAIEVDDKGKYSITAVEVP